MNRIFLFVTCLFSLIGCVTVVQETGTRLTRINNILAGMNKDQVMKIMGNEVTIGYEVTNSSAGTTKPLTIKNPQRTETLTKGHRTLEVYYYLTHIRQADGVITDDELTPLVFEHDQLVGKGWDYVNKIR